MAKSYTGTFTSTDELLVNTTTAGGQFHQYHTGSVTGLVDGGYIIVWTGESATTSKDIYMQRYDKAGKKIGLETKVNSFTAGVQTLAQVTLLDGGGWVVAWTS